MDQAGVVVAQNYVGAFLVPQDFGFPTTVVTPESVPDVLRALILMMARRQS